MRSLAIATALAVLMLGLVVPDAHAQAPAVMRAGSTWLITVIRAGALILISIAGLMLFSGGLRPVTVLLGLAGLAIAIYPQEIMAFF